MLELASDQSAGAAYKIYTGNMEHQTDKKVFDGFEVINNDSLRVKGFIHVLELYFNVCNYYV